MQPGQTQMVAAVMTFELGLPGAKRLHRSRVLFSSVEQARQEPERDQHLLPGERLLSIEPDTESEFFSPLEMTWREGKWQ